MAQTFDALDLGETEKRLPPSASFRNCTIASFEMLEEAADGRAKAFIWPDEGAFTKAGNFRFNADHSDFEPLLIDKLSASMMLTLYRALNETNQKIFRQWVTAGRGEFAALFEMTQERVTITGFSTS